MQGKLKKTEANIDFIQVLSVSFTFMINRLLPGMLKNSVIKQLSDALSPTFLKCSYALTLELGCNLFNFFFCITTFDIHTFSKFIY